MKLLFVCSQNRRRSLTAEKLFNGYEGHEARSAGTESNSRIKLTEGLAGWADIVFCMEKKHVRRCRERFSGVLCGKDIICLNIADEYEYMDDELQDILMSTVTEFISENA